MVEQLRDLTKFDFEKQQKKCNSIRQEYSETKQNCLVKEIILLSQECKDRGKKCSECCTQLTPQ